MTESLAQRAEAVIREVAEEAILPRFRALGGSQIDEKTGPDDLVTVADREAEALLARRLLDLLPGSTVVGEEAVSADPSVLDRLDADAVWIVDPVDGTGNFVKGKERFGVMVALVRRGETVLGLVYPPTTGDCAVAEKGAGATFGGRPIWTRKGVGFERAYGDYSRQYVDEPLRSRFADALEGAGGSHAGRCSAWAYLEVAKGEADFVFQYQMTVWDHAPGVLLVDEAGGRTGMLPGGEPYRPIRQANRPMLCCGDAALWDAYAEALLR
ncbi:inositol monophosphatase family protein [Parvularcula dongshanensis]|uniref:Fructose-1,6-bisphosphatase/inositol monophosphatase family enzyme n=1 Tax=Parvularcula dongshanensis TaxID=1173995 RepID=A0A840I4J6_9PROT|nr:inositol monophosphatase [Parvularcula dongshanensis]MBB4659886.1 fructose-1,6-bisphosphatase/inositol monophosphatase family enzyme [Parvularcula dongshanensis]